MIILSLVLPKFPQPQICKLPIINKFSMIEENVLYLVYFTALLRQFNRINELDTFHRESEIFLVTCDRE